MSVSKVQAIIKDQFGLRHIPEVTDNFDSMGADSIDMIELVMYLEENYNIEIKDSEIASVTNCNELYNMLVSVGAKL